MTELTVVKQDPFGGEMMRWPVVLLQRSQDAVVLEAHFKLSGHHMGEIPLEVGDRFVESYYADRWYNCYEVHDHADDHIKGWYYNIATPAQITQDAITFRDLILDLLVYPDGRREILDEDELEEVDLPAAEKQRIRQALQNLMDELDAK